MGFSAVLQNNNKKAKEFHADAEFNLAKALFRLNYNHAALSRFVSILQKGQKHKHFKNSKEWLLFISRKTADQAVVLEEIARYGGEDLPEKYADEFHLALAKLFFRKGNGRGGLPG